jgi:hypothetical protein
MNQILHALADEGYLPGGNPDTTSPGTTSPSSTIAGETPR